MLQDKMPFDWKAANTGEIVAGYGGSFEIGPFWFALSPDVDDDDYYRLCCTVSDLEFMDVKIPMSQTPAQIMRDCATWVEGKASELKLAAQFFQHSLHD